jgi:uncharacterized membrane protein
VQSRSLDRVKSFTDGTVAIALTLLVLPLAQLAGDSGQLSVGQLISQHVHDFTSFLLSFFVIALFWQIHRRIFDTLDRPDETLLTLNTFWLLGIVFLPVPTAVLTFSTGPGNSAAVVYLLNMTYLATLGLLLNGWIRAHPALQRPGAANEIIHGFRRSAVVCGYFAIVTLAAIPLGASALFFLLLLPLAQNLTGRWSGKS